MMQKSKMFIRPYQESDESRLVELWSSCGLVVPHNDPHEEIVSKIVFQPDWLLVGFIEDQLVASVMIGYDGHRGWINYLAVSPKYQKQGYGKEIMQKAEDILRSVHCPKINLQVREFNKGVIAFYEKLGYSVEPILSMGKRIKKNDRP